MWHICAHHFFVCVYGKGCLAVFFCSFVGLLYVTKNLHSKYLLIIATLGCANTCEQGSNIAIPSFVTGSIDNEPLTQANDCIFGNVTNSVIWYTFTPSSSSIITVNTCGSDFDTVLSVYSSSCSELTCITANDDLSEPCFDGVYEYGYLLSSVTFCANAGTEYKILLRGYGGETGSYQINIEAGESCEIPPNDECTQATVISSLPQTMTLTTTFANGGYSICGLVSENDHSLWYTIQGTGGVLIASTCNLETTFDTAIAVFSGYVFCF